MGKMGERLRLKSIGEVVEIGLEAQPWFISALGIGSSINTKEGSCFPCFTRNYQLFLVLVTKTSYLADWVRRAV